MPRPPCPPRPRPPELGRRHHPGSRQEDDRCQGVQETEGMIVDFHIFVCFYRMKLIPDRVPSSPCQRAGAEGALKEVRKEEGGRDR